MKHKKELQKLLRRRDAALLSLNKEKILVYMRAYDVPIPPDDIFWLVVHKARTAVISLPPAVRAESEVWLRAHGSSGFFVSPVVPKAKPTGDYT